MDTKKPDILKIKPDIFKIKNKHRSNSEKLKCRDDINNIGIEKQKNWKQMLNQLQGFILQDLKVTNNKELKGKVINR